PPFSCDSSNAATRTLLFCRTSLPIRRRVEDLVSRLTLEEKISQLVNSAAAIPRLGIPAYEWWSEALHGVSNYGLGVSFSGKITGATSFPQVILSAATFDSRLWYRIGKAAGTEARAVFNEGQGKGMTFWAPNINIFRDPRWGRGQETPGEDPLVASKYAVAFVTGFQGGTPKSRSGDRLDAATNDHLLASACCKHFTAYDLERWNGVTRLDFDAKVTKQDLADTFQPPFKSCVVEGKASGIMCAYNRVNGIPNCADHNLLTSTARHLWGFHGYITSDCNAVSIIHDIQNYAKLPEDAVADVLKAGMDVECGSYLQSYTKSAVDQNKLPVSEIDRALHNLFSVRMRLGLFDGDPRSQVYGKLGADHVCTQAHQDLALETARNGIVLLKNSGNLLPLSESHVSSLAVIGPNANSAYVLLGDYEGPPCKSVEILKALRKYVEKTSFLPGCDFVNCTSANVEAAVGTAREAEHVVMVMGLNQDQEREDHDRVDLKLPGQQETLITAVASASKNPVILVLLSGGPVDVSFARDDPKIGSILWAGYPGEAGGIALAEIIFGEHNPGGKLPVTWYPNDFIIKTPMTDMRMRSDPSSGYPGRTYRFYNGPKVFEFGHGLSYTTYSYRFNPAKTPNAIHLNRHSADNYSDYLSVSDIGTDTCAMSNFSAHVGVENTGEVAGKHPVLLFARSEEEGSNHPVKKLVGFRSVVLRPKERIEVEFVLNP
ncbi:hypothetical protein M569_03875, partial [Genlisea aurea]